MLAFLISIKFISETYLKLDLEYSKLLITFEQIDTILFYMKLKLFWRNIIWALIVFILCSIPGDDLPKTSALNIPHFDKIVHFGMFFIMGIFLIAELRFQTRLSRLQIVAITVVLIATYGGIIEYLQQYYFTNRSGDYIDLLADILGGIFSIILYPWLKKQKDLLLNRKPFSKISFLKKIL
jgi:VanZ family protein